MGILVGQPGEVPRTVLGVPGQLDGAAVGTGAEVVDIRVAALARFIVGPESSGRRARAVNTLVALIGTEWPDATAEDRDAFLAMFAGASDATVSELAVAEGQV